MGAKRAFNGLIIALAIASIAEAIAGVILLLYYKPEVNDAYQSLLQIKGQKSLDWLQGFHHWLSALMIAFAVFTLLFGLLGAAYRDSSKKLWVSSVLFVVVYGLLQLTGHLLPWDQHAVRTAVIETGIAQSAPAVGQVQAGLLRGGNAVGEHTLSTWFWAHVAVLTLVLILLTWLSWRKARINGSAASATAIGFLLLVVAAGVLAWLVPVRFGDVATAADFNNYSAKPEWYILPLHELLTIFQRIDPQFGWVGTMLVPGLLLLLVLLAPWLDVRVRRGGAAVFGPAIGLLIFAGSVALCTLGWAEVASPAGPNRFGTESAAAPVKLDSKLIAQGKDLIEAQGCTGANGCHVMNGPGQNGAPSLAGTGTRHPSLDWQMKHLANPPSVSPGSTMPGFAQIGQSKIQALAEYLLTLK